MWACWDGQDGFGQVADEVQEVVVAELEVLDEVVVAELEVLDDEVVLEDIFGRLRL